MINPHTDCILSYLILEDGQPGERRPNSVIVTLGTIFTAFRDGWQVNSIDDHEFMMCLMMCKGEQTCVYVGCWQDLALVVALADFCAAELNVGQVFAGAHVQSEALMFLAAHNDLEIVCGNGAEGATAENLFPKVTFGKVATILAVGINDIDVLLAAAQSPVEKYRDALLACQAKPGHLDLIKTLIANIIRPSP